MLSEEQMKQRDGRVGSSHIAAICGLDPHEDRSPFAMWMKFTGQLEAPKENRRMALGHKLEGTVAEIFEMDHPGISVVRCGETWTRPEWPDFIATPDFLTHEDESIGILEIKTASHWLKGSYADERIPEKHVCQLQWQLGFRDTIDHGWVCAFMGTGDDETPAVRFKKDPDLIKILHDKAHEFMESVRKGTPPPVRSGDAKMIERYVSRNLVDGKIIDLPKEQYHGHFESWADFQKKKAKLRAELKEIEKNEAQIENELAMALGDAEAGECGYYLVCWDWYRRKAEEKPRAAIEKRVLKIKDVK